MLSWKIKQAERIQMKGHSGVARKGLAVELIRAETWMKRRVMGKPRSKQREHPIQNACEGNMPGEFRDRQVECRWHSLRPWAANFLKPSVFSRWRQVCLIYSGGIKGRWVEAKNSGVTLWAARWVQSQMASIWTPILPLTSCVALDKLSNCSDP